MTNAKKQKLATSVTRESRVALDNIIPRTAEERYPNSMVVEPKKQRNQSIEGRNQQPNVTVKVSGGANIQSMSINFNTNADLAAKVMPK